MQTCILFVIPYSGVGGKYSFFSKKPFLCISFVFLLHVGIITAAMNLGSFAQLHAPSLYSQPHLIGIWLIGSSGSDQDFSPDKPLL